MKRWMSMLLALSGGGSLMGDITHHEWFGWTSTPGELSHRGL